MIEKNMKHISDTRKGRRNMARAYVFTGGEDDESTTDNYDCDNGDEFGN